MLWRHDDSPKPGCDSSSFTPKPCKRQHLREQNGYCAYLWCAWCQTHINHQWPTDYPLNKNELTQSWSVLYGTWLKFCAQILCSNSLPRFCAQIMCPDSVPRFSAQILCSNLVLKFCAQIPAQLGCFLIYKTNWCLECQTSTTWGHCSTWGPFTYIQDHLIWGPFTYIQDHFMPQIKLYNLGPIALLRAHLLIYKTNRYRNLLYIA